MNSILRRSEVLSGDVPAFVAGGGECATLIGGLDWSLSPLGPIEGWPDSLRTATAIVLRSPLPMALLWGPDGILLYNDGYAPFTGGRHPAALGRPMRETLPDLLGFHEDALRLGLAGGTRSYKDVELLVDRGGRAEPAFLNLDYSPVPDDDGHPPGCWPSWPRRRRRRSALGRCGRPRRRRARGPNGCSSRSMRARSWVPGTGTWPPTASPLTSVSPSPSVWIPRPAARACRAAQ